MNIIYIYSISIVHVYTDLGNFRNLFPNLKCQVTMWKVMYSITNIYDKNDIYIYITVCIDSMIICHSHDIHHSLWRNPSRQNCLTMEINRASNLLENKIGYLEALCFVFDTNQFHPPATIYILSYTCCKKNTRLVWSPWTQKFETVKHQQTQTQPLVDSQSTRGMPEHCGSWRPYHK